MADLIHYPALTKWVRTYSGQHLQAEMYGNAQVATMSCAALADLDRLIQCCPETKIGEVMS